MSDIVERLRGLNAEHPPFGAAQEAADEIERLRQQLAEYERKSEMDYAVMAGDTALITGLKNDLATVTKERDELLEAVKQWVKCCELSKTIRTEVAIPLRALAKVGAGKTGEVEQDLNKCPSCGGPADNGFSREIPPSPYYCTKCMEKMK